MTELTRTQRTAILDKVIDDGEDIFSHRIRCYVEMVKQYVEDKDILERIAVKNELRHFLLLNSDKFTHDELRGYTVSFISPFCRGDILLGYIDEIKRGMER